MAQIGDIMSPGSGNGVEETLANSYGTQDPNLYPAPVGQVWSSPYMDNQPSGEERLWANLYALPDNQASQTVVQTQNMELWGLRKSDQQWTLLQSSNTRDPGIWQGNTNPGFGGGKYDYPTVTTMYGPLDIQVQGSVASFNPGGNDAVEHWWPTNKPEAPWASFNPSDYEGYYAKADMRIDGPDAGQASYVAQIGVDPHLGHGRWNKLTTGWQTASITTLPEGTLRSSPPPDGGSSLTSAATSKKLSVFGTDRSFNETVAGDSADNTLTGGNDDDILIGRAGKDVLVGGFGNDSLTGGVGADSFSFNQPSKGIDTITDFVAGKDTISVSAADFGGGLTVGAAITTDQFFLGSGATAATDANQRFIYNTTDGALFFDADGNGTASGAVQIAQLTGIPSISHNDIFVAT